MKLYLYIFVICFTATHQAQSQDIFGEQIWELTDDLNNDGWVDPGDIISIQVKITHNGEATESISIENLLEHSGLELLPQTVSCTKGTIIKGSNSSDSSILIEDVVLSAPWGYATLLFSAKINSDPRGISPITNHTSLVSSMGSIATNSISLPRRTDYTLDESKFGYGLVIIVSLILVGLLSYIFKKPWVTTVLSNNPSG